MTTFMVLELEYGKTSVGPVLQIVGSLPGKDDTIRWHYDIPRGVPDAPTMVDIAAKVDDMVATAIVTFCGVQGVLPAS
jgi:hypothetical protein